MKQMLSFLYEIDTFAGSTQFYSIAVILNIARIVKAVLPQVTVCLICLACLCLEHLNPRYLLTMPLSQSVTSRLETSWYRDFSHFFESISKKSLRISLESFSLKEISVS